MNIIDANIYNNLDLLPFDLQGWNGNSNIFSELINKTKPNLIIEVGTWKGQSAINMANCLKSNNISGRIICVDTWLGALEFWDRLKHTPERNLKLKNGYPQIYYQFLSNVVHLNLQNYIQPFPTTSSIAAQYFKNNNITANLIYLDGSHEYEDIKSDIKNYLAVLKTGGTLFGDDYNNFTGVQKAVDELLPSRCVKDGFWIYTE